MAFGTAGPGPGAAIGCLDDNYVAEGLATDDCGRYSKSWPFEFVPVAIICHNVVQADRTRVDDDFFAQCENAIDVATCVHDRWYGATCDIDGCDRVRCGNGHRQTDWICDIWSAGSGGWPREVLQQDEPGACKAQ